MYVLILYSCTEKKCMFLFYYFFPIYNLIVALVLSFSLGGPFKSVLTPGDCLDKRLWFLDKILELVCRCLLLPRRVTGSRFPSPVATVGPELTQSPSF